MSASAAVGRYGERVARQFLVAAGWQVLACNWRCELGELDIVALDGVDLVAVEVKTRRSEAFGAPAEAVTWAKLARLRILLGAWLQQNPQGCPDVRIDVIEVLCAAAGPAQVRHLRGVG